MHESVAVIIPTFNREHCLGQALESVYKQTLTPTVVCVVDDGSDDGTKQFIQQNFPDVIYYYQSNQGVSCARNKGVSITESHWLAFLDSDDEWFPTKLELQLRALAIEPETRLIHCDEIWYRNGVRVNQMDKHRKSGGHIFDRCLPLCAISPSAVLLARDLFNEVGGFDETLPACEDYDLWLRICSRYPVHYIDQPLLNKHGGHDDQLSRKHWGMDRFRVQALEKLLNSSQLSSEQYQAAITTLIEKSKILKDGAEKRNNAERVNFYQSLMEKYSA